MFKTIELPSITEGSITNYINELITNPMDLITFIIDITIVILLVYKFIGLVKGTRALQLLKGITLLIIITILSSIFNLRILNFILTSFMTYGVILLIIMF